MVASARCRLFSHANLKVLCGNLKQLLYTLRLGTHQDKNLFLNRRMANTKGAFHWDDPDQDQ